MALDFMDGFDLYADATAVLTVWSAFSAPSFDTTGGRFGGGSVLVDGQNKGIHFVLDNAKDYITVGFAIKPDLNADGYVFAWAEDGTPNVSFDLHAGVHITTTGVITLRGDGGTILATSSVGAVSSSAYSYLEFSCFRNGSTGTVALSVDGSPLLSASGVDTRDATTGSYAHFAAYTTTMTFALDDVYILSDATAVPTQFGNVRIETILPDSDTAQADWTPLAGSGFSNIDDTLGTNGDGDSSYVGDSVIANASEFGIENLTGSPATVHAIALNTRAAKTDAGSVGFTPYIDSSGTSADGTEVLPAEAVYGLSFDFFETDPNTAGAWSEASINALKLGIKISS